jgi:hypothetical protein
MAIELTVPLAWLHKACWRHGCSFRTAEIQARPAFQERVCTAHCAAITGGQFRRDTIPMSDQILCVESGKAARPQEMVARKFGRQQQLFIGYRCADAYSERWRDDTRGHKRSNLSGFQMILSGWHLHQFCWLFLIF